MNYPHNLFIIRSITISISALIVASGSCDAGTRGFGRGAKQGRLVERDRVEKERAAVSEQTEQAAVSERPQVRPLDRALSPAVIEDLNGMHGAVPSYAGAKASDAVLRKSMRLEQCIELALAESHAPKVGQASRLIAEAQHRQALAAYWPHLSMTGFSHLRSEAPTFEFPGLGVHTPEMQFTTPEMQFQYPGGAIRTPASAIQVPAGALYQGSPGFVLPVDSQTVRVPAQTIQVPSQQLSVPSQYLEVPAQKFELADRTTYGVALEAKWLLADGGERRGRRRAALAGVEAARQEERAETIELISDVRRYYAGAVLARELVGVAEDVHERMVATLELTQTFYEGGSMQVTKMDYLRNKVVVDALQSGLEQLRGNYELACAALTHRMGLGWDSKIEPAEERLRYEELPHGTAELIGRSYQFNPDWQRLLAGLDAAGQGVKQARAGFAPKVAFLGKIHAIENGHEGGLATDENLNAWTVGVGVEMPVFRGFLTKNQVAEARARLEQLRHQQVLLEEGLAMRVKKSCIEIGVAQGRVAALGSAAETAAENRDLTDRAYRAGMAEADEIFRALIMDALSRAQGLKARYDAVRARIELDAAVGAGFSDLLADALQT